MGIFGKKSKKPLGDIICADIISLIEDKKGIKPTLDSFAEIFALAYFEVDIYLFSHYDVSRIVTTQALMQSFNKTALKKFKCRDTRAIIETMNGRLNDYGAMIREKKEKTDVYKKLDSNLKSLKEKPVLKVSSEMPDFIENIIEEVKKRQTYKTYVVGGNN